MHIPAHKRQPQLSTVLVSTFALWASDRVSHRDIVDPTFRDRQSARHDYPCALLFCWFLCWTSVLVARALATVARNLQIARPSVVAQSAAMYVVVAKTVDI